MCTIWNKSTTANAFPCINQDDKVFKNQNYIYSGCGNVRSMGNIYFRQNIRNNRLLGTRHTRSFGIRLCFSCFYRFIESCDQFTISGGYHQNGPHAGTHVDYGKAVEIFSQSIFRFGIKMFGRLSSVL